ncbi:orotidine-5'-phosphate decarboxylase [Robiginitalea sp. M366]|uniref:orotidine-5'-phosphate decarboxylase n=1 Tax=Robiginitalea aestuariiviva TaxID=3036903 RepID=UPI00240D5B50|nr:orotidine-5'-phosphate decarboxylase [Robiginitalea aestuariiviva]MDG1572285.1 orotidine-5'-phosphate decarboxylase [Robiginitalea aestuariiviva]
MTLEHLEQHIRRKSSFLCVGLDTDLDRIPAHLKDLPDPIFAFNKAIIDATRDYCVAYKPNSAFYEAYGAAGWQALQRTIEYLNATCPDHFTIADAKRGDIGNTATRYAKAFFETLDFDAITVAPYMGRDSVEPFLAFEGKYTILLALTSNPGAFDFQTLQTPGGMVCERVLEESLGYQGAERLMFVVGATKAEYLAEIRKRAPKSFLLIPGVGAQGGSLEEVCRYGLTEQVGLLVNSSRGIIYASSGQDFAEKAAESAADLQAQMAKLL